MLGCSSAVFVVWRYLGVLNLQGCLDGWFVSSYSRMNTSIQGFLAEYCTVARLLVLFISAVVLMLWLISLHF